MPDRSIEHDIDTPVPNATLLRQCLRETCVDISWPVGHVYLVDTPTAPLTSTEIWYLADPERFAGLVSATRLTRFKKITDANIGTGLPRRVAISGTPVWLPDVGRDPRFLRRALVGELGIGSALGIAIRLRDQVRYVLEFFRVDSGDAEPDVIACAQRHAAALEHRLETSGADRNLQP